MSGVKETLKENVSDVVVVPSGRDKKETLPPSEELGNAFVHRPLYNNKMAVAIKNGGHATHTSDLLPVGEVKSKIVDVSKKVLEPPLLYGHVDTKESHHSMLDGARIANHVHKKDGATHHFDSTKAGANSEIGDTVLPDVKGHTTNYIECNPSLDTPL